MSQGTPPRPAGLLPRPPLWERGRLLKLIALFGVAVVATVVSFAIVSRISGPRLLPPGSPAPQIALDDSNGGRVVILGANAPARPTVLEFFETTCAICQREVAPLCQVHTAHAGADFYALDAARESAAAVNGFRTSQGGGCITFPVLLDPQSSVLRAYSVTVVPTVYLVDTRGRVVYSGTGAGGVDGLDAALRSLHA
ncbi:MAG TPA: TlpA family protein disulfide reductase [Candidatus Dormibacteraeota bacterium]|jgi:peroxiredoxin|nr:TlpA family protein disulfide reductase [Candidatus Dormibacteraeota bacterium]